MDVLEKDEFLKAYRNIAGHLKRKFVRKPNVAEAIESYGELIVTYNKHNNLYRLFFFS